MNSFWEKRIYCGEVSENHQDVTVMGWVDTIRDHGQLLFIHLRDIRGVVQIVFNPETHPKIYDLAQELRTEYVIVVQGKVRERTEENQNLHIKTGNIEIYADQLTLLSQSNTPPFIISEKDKFDTLENSVDVDEDLRLKYRYLDLRRPSLQLNFVKRYEFIKLIRQKLDTHHFIEVETPTLTKSTPEGARDYLVPSRIHAHRFYALPQSPQLFKQLLMVSGFDRYFQIVKCYRDEDLRPNRQPEFTQVDIEASFIDETFIFNLIEDIIQSLFDQQGIKLATPFIRMNYDDAMNLYGNDHPDMRFDMTMQDVTHLLTQTEYKIFQTIIKKGGVIKGITIKNQGHILTKNMLQEDLCKKVIPKLGGKGMSWMRVEDGALRSNIDQFFSTEELSNLKQIMKAENNDVVVFVADTSLEKVNGVLGRFRLYIANRLNLIDTKKVCACWITGFPLFELKDGRLSSMHHPFTRPVGPIASTDLPSLLKLKACAYDVVINGEEVGGGSLRIYQKDLQNQIFGLLGLTEQEIDEKFGFFVKAFDYGMPPHGGIALGLDRLVAMLLNTHSIRDVIAFPKNRMAYCPLTQSPSLVSKEQLDTLKIKFNEKGA